MLCTVDYAERCERPPLFIRFAYILSIADDAAEYRNTQRKNILGFTTYSV